MEKQVKPEHEENESHRENRVAKLYYRALKRSPLVTMIFTVPPMWLTILIPLGVIDILLPAEHRHTADIIFFTAWSVFGMYVIIGIYLGARKRGIF